jgi:hypothetical protein
MRTICPVILGFVIAAISSASAAESVEPGFRPLFNGKDMTGWHVRHSDAHNCWSVLPDGVLKNTVERGTHGVDLVTEQKFWNFTARFDPRSFQQRFLFAGPARNSNPGRL